MGSLEMTSHSLMGVEDGFPIANGVKMDLRITEFKDHQVELKMKSEVVVVERLSTMDAVIVFEMTSLSLHQLFVGVQYCFVLMIQQIITSERACTTCSQGHSSSHPVERGFISMAPTEY